jgi:hypothetical protein
MLASKYLILPKWWYNPDLGMLLITLRELVAWSLASALLGLMLSLSVSKGSHFILRTCLLMAGLEAVSTLIATVVVRSPVTSYAESLKGNWQIVFIGFVSIILGMLDGLFTGAGLGLSIGGWESCKRYALRGMLAFGIGSAIGYIIEKYWLSTDWIWGTGYPGTAGWFVHLISICVNAIIAGGILGWMWGKDNPVGMPNEKVDAVASA